MKISPQVVMPRKKASNNLDSVLLKERNLTLAPRQGPDINSRACLCVLPKAHHHTQCWLTNQRLILLFTSCLETPKTGSGPTNLEQSHLVRDRRRSHLVTQYVQGPNTAPPHAG